MLEEVWNTEEDTPPDGLIFAKARADLFTNNEIIYTTDELSFLNVQMGDMDYE